MKIHKPFIITSILLVVLLLSACNGKPLPESGLVTFEAEDDLTVYADLYRTEDDSAPYIILFHQADYSRGEYLEIAPRLNEMGFNCLAVDQRSGGTANDVKNMTVEAYGYGYSYADAFPDLKAALLYVQKELRAKKIIIWGSSYSAALSLALASEFPEDVNAVLAFSPGEYFKLNDKTIADYAKNIQCPVFIAAEAAITNSYNLAKPIYDNTPDDNRVYCETNIHGSSALWSDNDNNVLYWQQVSDFLNSI